MEILRTIYELGEAKDVLSRRQVKQVLRAIQPDQNDQVLASICLNPCKIRGELDFEYHRHDQRPLLRLLGYVPFEVRPDFFFDHAVVGLLFVARQI